MFPSRQEPSPSARNRKKWEAWIPAVAWLGMIAVESTGTFSAAITGGWLFPIFHFLGMTRVHFEVFHAILRKCGHFVGYFTLSVLLFRAWRATIPTSTVAAWSQLWANTAWLTTTLVASLDEWHQTYIPTRTGSLHDVMLDSAAALTAQLVIWAIFVRRNTW